MNFSTIVRGERCQKLGTELNYWNYLHMICHIQKDQEIQLQMEIARELNRVVCFKDENLKMSMGDKI